MEKDEAPVIVGEPVAAAPATPARGELDDWLSPSLGTDPWSIGLFGCCACQVKNCNSFAGCLNLAFCGVCTYSAAVAKTGIDPLGTNISDEKLRCIALCCGVTCVQLVPCQDILIESLLRLEFAKKYGIEETAISAFFKTCCCRECANAQVLNEVLVREKYRQGCASVQTEEAVQVNEMER